MGKNKRSRKKIAANILVGLVVLVLIILAYYQFTRTSWLEALANLNPQNNEKPGLTPSETLALFPQNLVIPEKWKKDTFLQERTLNLPNGFKVNLYASGLGKARMLAFDSKGNLFLTIPTRGQVVALPDADKDGVADDVKVFAENLEYPTGIAFHKNDLYIAGTTKVYKMSDGNGDLKADGMETIISNLPGGGNHITRTIAFLKDGRMIVSVGSSCNACVNDERRGLILQFDEDGENEKIFAEGLRNAVGMIVNENTGKVWATDNGRDFLGDELPPEEVDVVEEGKHYGWPYCYGVKKVDAEFKRPGFCEKTEPPLVEMQAHSAPLGLRFYYSTVPAREYFASELDSTLFVAFHGSWNRREPTGYKVVNIKFPNPTTPIMRDFLTGFLVNNKAWGRPVDVIEGSDGAIYVSDDFAGAVYRIIYSE